MKKDHQTINKAMISGSYRMSDDFQKVPNQEDVFEVVNLHDEHYNIRKKGYGISAPTSLPDVIRSLHSKYPGYSVRSIIPMNDGQDGDAKHWLIHFRKDNSSLQSDVAELNDKVQEMADLLSNMNDRLNRIV